MLQRISSLFRRSNSCQLEDHTFSPARASGDMSTTATRQSNSLYIPSFLPFVASSLTTTNEGTYFYFYLHYCMGPLPRSTKIYRCLVIPCMICPSVGCRTRQPSTLNVAQKNIGAMFSMRNYLFKTDICMFYGSLGRGGVPSPS